MKQTQTMERKEVLKQWHATISKWVGQILLHQKQNQILFKILLSQIGKKLTNWDYLLLTRLAFFDHWPIKLESRNQSIDIILYEFSLVRLVRFVYLYFWSEKKFKQKGSFFILRFRTIKSSAQTAVLIWADYPYTCRVLREEKYSSSKMTNFTLDISCSKLT